MAWKGDKLKMDDRIIERFNIITGNWDVINFADLVDKDIFRIFDLGIRYINKNDGNNVWISKGEPYINNDGILTIQTIY